MLERLKNRWKVSTIRMILILTTFALGGSLTGFLGKKLMGLLNAEPGLPYVITYVGIITLLWPFMVLLVSLPLGQFSFFKKYLSRIAGRLFKRKSSYHGSTDT